MYEYALSRAQIDFLATWFTKGFDEAMKGVPPDREYSLEELGLHYRQPTEPWMANDERFIRLTRASRTATHVMYFVHARWRVLDSWSPVAKVHVEVNGEHYGFTPTNRWDTLRPEWFAFERHCVFRLALRLQGSAHTGGSWGEVLHRFCCELLQTKEFPMSYPNA